MLTVESFGGAAVGAIAPMAFFVLHWLPWILACSENPRERSHLSCFLLLGSWLSWICQEIPANRAAHIAVLGLAMGTEQLFLLPKNKVRGISLRRSLELEIVSLSTWWEVWLFWGPTFCLQAGCNPTSLLSSISLCCLHILGVSWSGNCLLSCRGGVCLMEGLASAKVREISMWVSRNACENVNPLWGSQGIERKKKRRKATSTVHVFTEFPECSSRNATYGIWGCAGGLSTTQLRYTVVTVLWTWGVLLRKLRK